ncbi:MAG: serine/threonine-protein kinase [Planctomycetaceae bacterium]|nr:serine/threonine-protein kinase [Planctomycetaceae bacterium]
MDDRGSSVSNQIDLICDEFEAAFRQGRDVRIEAYATRLAPPARARLLVELIALEVCLYREAGVTLGFEGYLRRFPEFAAELTDLRRELEREAAEQPGATPPEGSTMPVTFTRVKHFLLRTVLGQGGFGTVWRAFDTRLHRDVAIKIPRKDRLNQLHIALMLREARAAAGLKHSNVVPVYEVGDGEEESGCYIVTGLIEGASLKNWLTQHKPSFRETAELVATIARALQHAHNNKVVHRDLKPANILMDADGAPHLADFGLAKRVDRYDSLSIEGQLVGTPNYMSPEQARGEHDAIDHRTDIYALGVILYELLTGQPPFKGELAWLLEQIARTPPPPPRTVNPAVPEDLEKICLKCLEKDPRARYPSASDVTDELHRYLNGESLRGVPVPLQKRVRKWAWRKRRFLSSLAATATVCLSLAGLGWWWSQPVTPRRLVKFETEPPGCEITVVRLDPETGEPDPDKIEHAHGKTPLTMRLVPGDYLVVAVLDEQRFHEVLRHVPATDETMPILDPHLYWQIDAAGCVVTELVEIPRPDVTLEMGFVEGTDSWRPSGSNNKRDLVQSRAIPSFYVDCSDQIPKRHTSSSGKSEFNNRFGRSNAYLEMLGKRMPSEMELLYILDRSRANGTEDSQDVLILSNGLRIEGLYSPPWEWTLRRASLGPKDESPPGVGNRLTFAGLPPKTAPTSGQPTIVSQAIGEWQDRRDVGVRGVRSIKPRRRKSDFVRVVSEN